MLRLLSRTAFTSTRTVCHRVASCATVPPKRTLRILSTVILHLVRRAFSNGLSSLVPGELFLPFVRQHRSSADLEVAHGHSMRNAASQQSGHASGKRLEVHEASGGLSSRLAKDFRMECHGMRQATRRLAFSLDAAIYVKQLSLACVRLCEDRSLPSGVGVGRRQASHRFLGIRID